MSGQKSVLPPLLDDGYDTMTLNDCALLLGVHRYCGDNIAKRMASRDSMKVVGTRQWHRVSYANYRSALSRVSKYPAVTQLTETDMKDFNQDQLTGFFL